MLDFTDNLESLTFESGLSEDEKRLLFLRSRSATLKMCGCAHAAYLCKLAQLLRESAWQSTVDSKNAKRDQKLAIGILGGGHIGKLLGKVLLETVGFKSENINISTRRPETLEDFKKKGVECYYDNKRLTTWADVLFLCILPSHLIEVCASIRTHLPQHCLVYSFVCAVPLNRISQLLSHTFILKPQYEFPASGTVSAGVSHSCVATAFKDPQVIAATCPFGMANGISMDQKWIFAVLYCLLNTCTSLNISSDQAVMLINELTRLNVSGEATQFTSQSFVNQSFASSLESNQTFPWFNLVDVQYKETPLSRFVTKNRALQDHLSTVYCSLLAPFSTEKKDTK